jgi:flagellar biosynthesis regulator FlaF
MLGYFSTCSFPSSFRGILPFKPNLTLVVIIQQKNIANLISIDIYICLHSPVMANYMPIRLGVLLVCIVYWLLSELKAMQTGEQNWKALVS